MFSLVTIDVFPDFSEMNNQPKKSGLYPVNQLVNCF